MIRIVDVNGQLKVTTNQQFRDNTFAILGSADQTKRFRFEVDGLTTATTRTATMLDASGTVPYYEYAGTWTAAQTFSANTLQSGGPAWAAGGLSGEPVGKHLLFGYDTAGSIGYIRSANNGTAFTELRLAGSNVSIYTGLASSVFAGVWDSNGNLGIGVTPSLGKLHVSQSVGDTFIASVSTSTVGGGFFRAGSGNGTTSFRYSALLCESYEAVPQSWAAGMYGTKNFQIYDITAAATRFTVDTSGNVGIGVTPTASGTKLFVGRYDSSSQGGRVSLCRASDNAEAWTFDAFGNTSTPNLRIFGPSGSASYSSPHTFLTSGEFGVNITPVAGGGKLQLGTGQSNGIGFQSGGVVDTYLYRDAGGVVRTDGILLLDGATTKTIKYTNGTANAAVATTLGSVGPTGSTAGNPQGWMRVNIGGTDRFIPYW